MMHDVKQGLEKATEMAKPQLSGWVAAAGLVERWLARSERVDALLEGLAPSLSAQERARAQHLFYGVVRWASRLESALAGLMTREPRGKVKAVLMIAGFELLEAGDGRPEAGTEATAKIVHHAVERAKGVCSPKEAGLVNAVARKLAGRLAEKYHRPVILVALDSLGTKPPTGSGRSWYAPSRPIRSRWPARPAASPCCSPAAATAAWSWTSRATRPATSRPSCAS